MSVIIRLQGLPWTASAMNIRHFFTGLNIPAGGVHIIGGEGGDAFIAFSSDEDARMAMKMNMSPLNGVPVQLFLSSKSEMQSVIEAARSGPSTTVAVPTAQQNNMGSVATNTPGIGQAAGMNMGVSQMGMQQQQMAVNPGMPNQNQQQNNMSGYPGMVQDQGQVGQPSNSMMGQKGGNFQMMQPHQQQQYPQAQGDASNSAMGNNYPGGMNNMGNQWQGYPGIGGQGENQNPNMNMSQFQYQNQSMMGGYENDQYSRFQNLHQQQQQQQQLSQGRDRPYSGGQGAAIGKPGHVGQEMMMGEGKMNLSQGPTESMMGMGHNQNRYGDGAGGVGNSGQVQYPGSKDTSMNQAFVPGSQRAGSMGKDKDGMATMPGQSTSLGVFSDSNIGGTGFSKDNYDADQLGNPPARMSRWGAEKKTEDSFPEQNQYYRNMHRDPMFRQGMGKDEGRKWPNQFPEDNQEPNDLFSRRGLNHPEPVSVFGERDSRMQGQYHGNFRNRQENFPGRFPPDRAQGLMGIGGSDRGSLKDENGGDGMPSTRYPPDDDEPMGESGRVMGTGAGGPLNEPRNVPEGRPMPPGNLKEDVENKSQIPLPDISRDGPIPSERRPRQRVSRFDRDEKGMPVDQSKPVPPTDEKRIPPEDRVFPPGNQPRFPQDDRYGEFSGGGRFPGRSFPDQDARGMGDDDRKFSGIGRPEGRPLPEDRFGRTAGEDRDKMGRPYPEDGMGRPGPDGRIGGPIPEDRDRMGRPTSEDRMGRNNPEDRFGRFAQEERAGRVLPDDRDRMGRTMPADRMWPGDRMRSEEMMRRRPGDNMIAPDDPRYTEREEEFRREGFDFEDRFRRGPGPMRGMGRQSGDHHGMRHPPEWREREGDFPRERYGGFRGEEERSYPYGPDDRYSDGQDRWNRLNRNTDSDQRPGLLETPNSNMGSKKQERGFDNTENVDGSGPFDMDQRFDRERRPVPGRWPGGMHREDEGFDHGHGGPAMEHGYGRGGGPRDFDSRAGRGRGAMMDRGTRGRGEPFGRGRGGGMPPFGRGRGDQSFDEHGSMGQDVDNRKIDDQFSHHSNQPAAQERPHLGGRGLLGDAPTLPPKPPTAAPADHGNASIKKEDPKGDTGDKRDIDNRPSPRRSDDRDRGRDRDRDRDRERDRRSYDDRRGGRDRDDRDRSSYRDRFGRDRDLRERDRRRSRSRSRERVDRDRDNSRYRLDNRDRLSRDKSSKSDSENSKTNTSTRPTRFLLIKDMPKSLSFRDVRRFFHPMEIPFDGIKLINDNEGNRIGEAYVYFHRLDDAVKSQKRHGERVEGRSISIQFTTEDDFQKAVDSFVPKKLDKTSAPVKAPAPTSSSASKPESTTKPQSDKRFIVHLKNLPLSITRQDISNFFKNLNIDNNGEAAYIEYDQSGVATGIGFVEFKSETDYKKALTQDGGMVNNKKISISIGNSVDCDKLKSVQGEMFQRAALRSIANKVGLNNTGPNVGQQPPNQQQPSKTALEVVKPPSSDNSNNDNCICVHIQGLPLLATHHDIRDFFSDCNIAPRGINIAHDGNGKPLGEGFVEFMLKSDMEKALKKDKTSLGRHIVAVKPIGKKEMTDRLGNAKQRGIVPPKLPISSPTSLAQGPTLNAPQIPNIPSIPFPKPPLPMNQQKMLPQNQCEPTPLKQEHQQPSQPSSQILQNQPPPDTQDSKCSLGPGSRPQHPQPPSQDMANKGPMHNQHLPTPHQPSAPLLQIPGQGPPLVVAPGGGKSFPPGVLNANWFYVRCQNFPPDISIGEIMQFFHGFRPIGESIRLHYSSEGQPTGNAVVGFGASEDANRALQRLHMTFCRHNPVSLHPA